MAWYSGMFSYVFGKCLLVSVSIRFSGLSKFCTSVPLYIFSAKFHTVLQRFLS